MTDHVPTPTPPGAPLTTPRASARLALAALWLGAGLACSDGAAPVSDSDARAPDTADPTDVPGDTFAPGVDLTEARWGLAGVLAVRDDAIDPAGSSLTFQQRGPGGDCDVAIDLLAEPAVVVDQAAPSPTRWWRIAMTTTGEPTPTGCLPTLPPNPHLGLGPTAPALRPGADRAGLPFDDALGLYLGARDALPVLVGLATDADPGGDTADSALSGTGDTADSAAAHGASPSIDTDITSDTDAPASTDGRWTLTMVFAMPYRPPAAATP